MIVPTWVISSLAFVSSDNSSEIFSHLNRPLLFLNKYNRALAMLSQEDYYYCKDDLVIIDQSYIVSPQMDDDELPKPPKKGTPIRQILVSKAKEWTRANRWSVIQTWQAVDMSTVHPSNLGHRRRKHSILPTWLSRPSKKWDKYLKRRHLSPCTYGDI